MIRILPALLSFLLFFFSFTIHAQINTKLKENIIKGRVVDAVTNKTLSDVNIQIKGELKGTSSDQNGEFSLPLKTTKITIAFSHIGYENYYLKINSLKDKDYLIQMIPKITSLDEVEIGAEKILNLIKDKPLFLIDYEFFENNILLIAYEDMKISKGRLILMDHYGDTISWLPFDNPNQLFKDCLDVVHVFSKDTSYQVYYDGQKLQLLYPVEKAKFLAVMENCVDKLDNKLFFQNYSLKNQQLIYTYFDTEDSSFHVFTESRNEALIPTVKNWDQYIRSYYQVGTGYSEFDKRFDDLCMFKAVYAPLVVVKDTLYCFNFSKEQLEVFSKRIAKSRTHKLEFHKGKKWKPELYKDEATDKIYTLSFKNGVSYIHEIDLNTCKLISSNEIPGLPHVEKIGVNNSWVYFLYAEKRNEFHQYYRYKHLFKMRLE